jgi:phospholipase/lecithinase/hemolysin
MLTAMLLSQADAHTWDGLYVFGDSYSDSGAGYIDGNGATAVVYFAEALNIPFTHAGDPNTSGKGLNFAVSGAQTGKSVGFRVRPARADCGSDEALLGRGMQTQVAEFAERVRVGTIRFSPETTLFFLAGGLNDASLAASVSISNLEGEVRTLYALGARYVMVALMPARLSRDSKSYRALNKAILLIPQRLQSELPGIHVKVSRWGAYYDQVFTNHRRYGITNTTDRCAGRALFGEDSTPCATPEAHYFYHEGHPSTTVHRIVGLKLEREVLGAFP